MSISACWPAWQLRQSTRGWARPFCFHSKFRGLVARWFRPAQLTSRACKKFAHRLVGGQGLLYRVSVLAQNGRMTILRNIVVALLFVALGVTLGLDFFSGQESVSSEQRAADQLAAELEAIEAAKRVIVRQIAQNERYTRHEFPTNLTLYHATLGSNKFRTCLVKGVVLVENPEGQRFIGDWTVFFDVFIKGGEQHAQSVSIRTGSELIKPSESVDQ